MIIITWLAVLYMLIGSLMYLSLSGWTKAAACELARLTYAAGTFGTAYVLATKLLRLG